MKNTKLKKYYAVVVLLLSGTVSVTTFAQQSAATDLQLSKAIIQGVAAFAANAQTHGEPLLLDSAAFRAALPGQSPSALVAALGNGAELSARSTAITCATPTDHCAVRNRGVFVSLERVAMTADLATATVVLLVTSDSRSFGTVVVGAKLELRLERSKHQWVLKRTTVLERY